MYKTVRREVLLDVRSGHGVQRPALASTSTIRFVSLGVSVASSGTTGTEIILTCSLPGAIALPYSRRC